MEFSAGKRKGVDLGDLAGGVYYRADCGVDCYPCVQAENDAGKDGGDGKIAAFVATVGTGGSLSGTGRYLKEQDPKIRIVAVEPADSPLLSKGYAAPHAIQGIGANFVPDNFCREICDQILTAETKDAIEASRTLAKSDGLLVGISSGAALASAIKLAKELGQGDEPIVVLLPDTGERYLSSGLFDE